MWLVSLSLSFCAMLNHEGQPHSLIVRGGTTSTVSNVCSHYQFGGSFVFIVALIRYKYTQIPVSARSELLVIMLGTCEAVIRAIAAGVSPCDSHGLHRRCDVPGSGACRTTGFKNNSATYRKNTCFDVR